MLLDMLRKRFVPSSKKAGVQARFGLEAAQKEVGGDGRVRKDLLLSSDSVRLGERRSDHLHDEGAEVPMRIERRAFAVGRRVSIAVLDCRCRKDAPVVA